VVLFVFCLWPGILSISSCVFIFWQFELLPLKNFYSVYLSISLLVIDSLGINEKGKERKEICGLGT
jgi:hypothetical protein